MFISSDASGEIYIVTRDEAANGKTGSSSSPGSSSGGGSAGGKPKSSALRQGVLSTSALVLSVLAYCIVL